MNKKMFIWALATTIAYFTVFWSSQRIFRSPPNSNQITTPVMTTPACEDSDLAIMITSQGNILCKSEDSLYIREQGKKYVVRKILKTETYFPSAMDLILFSSNQEIVIEKLNSDKTQEVVFSKKLTSDITPISVFINSNEKEVTIYVSAQKIAKSVKDIKSVLYVITLSLPLLNNSTEKSYEFQDMVAVKNVHSKGKVVELQEMFPFLLEKHFLFNLENNKVESEDGSCSYYPYATNDVDVASQHCSQMTDLFIKSSNGNVLFNDQTNTLSWQQNSQDNVVPLISNITPEEWQLVTKYTTRKGKRVYNCFDFSESLQITLSTCIQEL